MIINWIALIAGFGAILGGNYLEGGHISSLIQPTAALIVGGGTVGATFLAITGAELSAGIKMGIVAFTGNAPNNGALVKEICAMAAQARKDGILSLENSIGKVKNAFLKKYLRYIIDGYDANVLKSMMEDEMHHEEEKRLAAAKVWETAGGFSPTIGIIGAVMGLIHVMSNLSDSSKLGSGIAVAFVATVYGVGAANLVLIPLGNKCKKMAKWESAQCDLIYIGLTGIQEGVNPRAIEERLKNMIHEHGGKGGHGEAKKAA